MAATGPWSYNWLREGSRRGRLMSDFGKKEAVRKNRNGGRKNKKERQTHGRPLLQASHRQVWQRRALDPLIDWGRVTCAADWWAILEKGSCEKKIEMVGKKIKWRGKLTAAAFCKRVAGRYGSDGHLIPLLTEGGRPARPTEEQFNWKEEAVRKNRNCGGKTKWRGELTITSFSMKLWSREWRQQDLIPLVNRGRASCAINGITI